MGGRRRKTKAEMVMTGADVKHPERMDDRADAPKPEGPLGPPPASFNPQSPSGSELIKIWDELVSQVPPGVLTVSDRMHVELTCRLMLRVRTKEARSGDYSRLDVLLGKMAMNPADRSKVNLTPGAGTGAGTAAKRSDAGGDSANRGNTFKDIAQETAAVRPN
jgi:hypothetical protein